MTSYDVIDFGSNWNRGRFNLFDPKSQRHDQNKVFNYILTFLVQRWWLDEGSGWKYLMVETRAGTWGEFTCWLPPEDSEWPSQRVEPDLQHAMRSLLFPLLLFGARARGLPSIPWWWWWWWWWWWPEFPKIGNDNDINMKHMDDDYTNQRLLTQSHLSLNHFSWRRGSPLLLCRMDETEAEDEDEDTEESATAETTQSSILRFLLKLSKRLWAPKSPRSWDCCWRTRSSNRDNSGPPRPIESLRIRPVRTSTDEPQSPFLNSRCILSKL